jgi:ATP-dependent helicase/nuclease subunit A
VAAQYEDQKRSLGKLDFDDLLSRAFRLLTHPDNETLRKRVSADLRLLLVDEFQDTDQLQVDLVKALCGPDFDCGPLFFVGDMKQSIYRFRGAEPVVFRKLQAQVKKRGQQQLTVNFRSQPAILSFVNQLFAEAFAGESPLEPDRPQVTKEPCVEFLWHLAPDKPGAAKARLEEARLIARRIRSLVDDDSQDEPIVDQKSKPPKPRRARLGDIAILFRALSDVQLYEEALREYDLDYYLVGGHAFFAQQEIYDVLNLLRAVASTADEVSLAGVLRSPFFALADETLFWLVESAGSLNAGLLAQSPAAALSPEEQDKVRAAAQVIRHLRATKDLVPIAALLGEALARTGYDAVLLAEFLGERKLANLQKLIERARVADASGAASLDAFITQLAQFVAREPKEALAATLPESANVIRLMTIHQAKGLEFPLVIIPDLDRSLSFRTPPAALDRELGPLVPPADDEDANAPNGMTLFKLREKHEDALERTRLLYVATTRAADHLILSSSIESFDKVRSEWMHLLADRFDIQTSTNAIRVAIDPPPVLKPGGRERGRDVLKALDEARELAEIGQDIVPPEVAAVPVDRTARRQFSFSRLTGQLVQNDPVLAPTGSENNGQAETPPAASVGGRGLGSLVHDVLARVDFAAPSDVAGWCEHLAPLVVNQNAEALAPTASELIGRFVESPRGRELAQAAAMHRELEFLLAWPPGEKNERGHYLHGFIDALYEDAAGEWNILDYKTNAIHAEAASREARRYEMQLYVYAMAVESALGRSPKTLVLHFLRPGVEHVFSWNKAARRRALEMVSDSILQMLTSGT